MTLRSLKTGETATVINCRIRRLCEMGVIPGAELHMALSGKPCIIGLSETRIGLGEEYQNMVTIRKEKYGSL